MSLVSIAIAWTAVFSLALFLVGMQSYRRAESPKLALVALGFLALFIKSAVLAVALFADAFQDDVLWLIVAIMDTAALLLIFMGIYKR